jgi:hypothetical protein
MSGLLVKLRGRAAQAQRSGLTLLAEYDRGK